MMAASTLMSLNCCLGVWSVKRSNVKGLVVVRITMYIYILGLGTYKQTNKQKSRDQRNFVSVHQLFGVNVQRQRLLNSLGPFDGL